MKKRITAVILLITQLMAVSALGGCKNTDASPVFPEFEENPNRSTMFKSSPVDVPESDGWFSYTFSKSDGRISCMASDPAKGEYYVYSFDERGYNGVFENIHPVSETERIQAYYALSNGKYVICETVMDGSYKVIDNRISLCSSDAATDEEVLFSTTCDSLLGEGMFLSANQNEAAGMGFSLLGACDISEDEYMIATSICIFGVDSKGEMLYKITPEDGEIFYQFAFASSGDIAVLLGDTRISNKIKFGIADTKNEKIAYVSNVSETLVNYMASSTNLISVPENGKGHSLYFTNNDGLYGVNISVSKNVVSEPVQIINWVESNVTPSAIRDIVFISPEKFIVNSYDSNYTTEFSTLTMIPKDQIVEKTVLTLAHGTNSFYYTANIIEFNKLNEKYKIEVKDYSKYNDIENFDYLTGLQTIVNEIIAGDIPDIMYFEYTGEGTYYNLMLKGAFADLYTYFDADPDVSRETLIPCLREPLEKNGKLYQLGVNYSLEAYFAKRSDIPYDTWSYEKMFDYMDSLDQDTVITNNMDFILGSSGIVEASQLGGFYFNLGFSDFIDYENVKVNFDSNLFIELLNRCKSYYDKQIKYIGSSEELKTVIEANYIYSIDKYIDIKYNSKLSQYKDELTIVPCPRTEEQTFENAGGIVSVHQRFCIMEKAKNKDGAWEFFKYMISDEVQIPDDLDRKASVYGFPLTQKAMDSYFEAIQNMYFYYNNNVKYTYTEPLTDEGKQKYGSGLAEVEFTDEDINELKSLIYNSKGKEIHDTRLYDIVVEEMNEFLYGNTGKTAEQTAKAIQSRASIFISETYG